MHDVSGDTGHALAILLNGKDTVDDVFELHADPESKVNSAAFERTGKKKKAHLVFGIGRDLESRLSTVIPEDADHGCALHVLESAKVDCKAAISSEVSFLPDFRLAIEKGLRGCQLTKRAAGKSRDQSLREHRAVNGHFGRRHGEAERGCGKRGGSRGEEGLLACSDSDSDQAFFESHDCPAFGNTRLGTVESGVEAATLSGWRQPEGQLLAKFSSKRRKASNPIQTSLKC